MNELNTSELLIALVIHFVLPLLGLIYYIYILKRMKIENIKNPPDIALFLIFLNYGGLLIIILTAYLWYWSLMATIGSLYILLISPIIMLGISIYYLKSIKLSKYHKTTFYSAMLYIPILVATYLIIMKK